MTADLKKILTRLAADSIVSLTHPRSEHRPVYLSLLWTVGHSYLLITNSSQTQVAKLKCALKLCGMQSRHTPTGFFSRGKKFFVFFALMWIRPPAPWINGCWLIPVIAEPIQQLRLQLFSLRHVYMPLMRRHVQPNGSFQSEAVFTARCQISFMESKIAAPQSAGSLETRPAQGVSALLRPASGSAVK